MNVHSTARGGVAIHTSGDGPDLLLLHANPGDHRDFDAVTPAFAERYRVHAVDWPGYGDSPPFDPPGSTSAMRYADLVPELLDALSVTRAVIIGNSIGGYAAARLAITHPERVRGLVLVNSGGFTRHTYLTRLVCRLKGSERLTRSTAGIHARVYLRRRTPVVDAMIARAREERHDPARAAVDAASWRSFTDPEHDLRQRAASISAPALLIWGSRDPNLPLWFDGRSAARSIPNAVLESVQTGHAAFAEAPGASLTSSSPSWRPFTRPPPQTTIASSTPRTATGTAPSQVNIQAKAATRHRASIVGTGCAITRT